MLPNAINQAVVSAEARFTAPPSLLCRCWHQHWLPSANEGMIELKQCTGYTMWIGAHDRWHRRLPRQLNLNPPALAVAAAAVVVVRRGVDNSTQGTMCCAPPKLVPWVKRTRGSSDGDTLIRDSQVFYHSVRLELDSFWCGMRSVQEWTSSIVELSAINASIYLVFTLRLQEEYLNVSLICREANIS